MLDALTCGFILGFLRFEVALIDTLKAIIDFIISFNWPNDRSIKYLLGFICQDLTCHRVPDIFGESNETSHDFILLGRELLRFGIHWLKETLFAEKNE